MVLYKVVVVKLMNQRIFPVFTLSVPVSMSEGCYVLSVRC